MNALAIEDEVERAKAFRQQAIDFVRVLESRVDEAETLRQLPPETISDLKSFGFSRLCQPRKYGGAELSLEYAVDILSVLARGCASTAWVCSIFTDHCVLLGMFPEQATEDIWGEDQLNTVSASYFPIGQVEPAEDGWRLSGKWGWASGCDHADWFIVGGFIHGDAGPAHNLFLVPRSAVEIEDNWNVMGLKGTGSKNIILKDAYVPGHRVLSLVDANGGAEARAKEENRPLYRLVHVAAVPFVFVAVALGIAESFLDSLTEELSSRQSMGRSLAELQSMQLHFAETAAELDCARLLIERDTSETMNAMRQHRALTMLERGRNRRNMAYAARLCRSSVNRLHDMTGARGIFDDHMAQRKFRDLQAAVRHIALSWDLAGTNCGEVMLGLEPSSPHI